MDPVFNETVQIVEFDEGFDTEVFFMYVFLVAGAFLVLFLVYTLLGGSKGKKAAPVSKPVETGTTNDDVDYEWIPRSAIKKTPGSQKTSPRQRKTNKRNAGSDTEWIPGSREKNWISRHCWRTSCQWGFTYSLEDFKIFLCISWNFVSEQVCKFWWLPHFIYSLLVPGMVLCHYSGDNCFNC